MLNLKSEEVVVLNGREMPRWIAERAGLLPVTITRTLRAFVSGPAFTMPCCWLPIGIADQKRLFSADKYMAPASGGWANNELRKDGFGNFCVAFWPALFYREKQP